MTDGDVKVLSAASPSLYASESFSECLKWLPRILDPDRHADKTVWKVV